MAIFDEFEDALEEASWCADNEKKVYIIRQKNGRFKVTPKSRMKKHYPHVEVGYKGRE